MTAGPPATSDPIAAVPPLEEIRRMLDDLTRRRTLLQSLLRTSVRISKYPPKVSQVVRDREAVAGAV